MLLRIRLSLVFFQRSEVYLLRLSVELSRLRARLVSVLEFIFDYIFLICVFCMACIGQKGVWIYYDISTRWQSLYTPAAK